MADTIPNLWSTADLKVSILTPIAILRTQATLLSQTTQRLLVGEVRTTTSDKGELIIDFDVVVPALNNYRHTLLTVKHTKTENYPATVFARGLSRTVKVSNSLLFSSSEYETRSVPSKTAYSDKEFISIMSEALKAPETIAKLQSLIIRSNEEISDSVSQDDRNTTETNDTKESA